MKLNLSTFPIENHEQAREAFDEGDALGFIFSAERSLELDAVLHNARSLKERGIFESALLNAYTGCRVNTRLWPMSVLEFLFNQADREKLLAAGDPLPAGESFTVYRGVAGQGPSRRVRSYSWTLDFARAEWFACRFDYLPNPTVYQANIRREEVLAFINDQQEQEVICRPVRCKVSLQAASLLASR